MSTTEPSFSIQETASCPHCGLHQFATAVGHNVASGICRRCGHPLGLVYYAFQLPRACEQSPIPDRASIKQSVGAFIRRLRMRRKISQEVLANRIAVHRTRVTRAEGGNSLSLSFLLRAVLAMDLDIDRIFVRVRDRKSDLQSGGATGRDGR